MKKKYCEYIFEVTETCNNGNERTIKKSVYSNLPYTDQTIFSIKNMLEDHHYYRVRFIKVKQAELFFME